MIGRSVAMLILSGLAVAAAYRPYEGVDPNTLTCDPEGQIFLLLPHFTDCNKFFMCAHGQEVEFTCSSADLIFDFEAQTCNWAWGATCSLRHPTEEGDGDDDIEGSGEGSQEWLPEHKTASPERAPLGLVSDLLDGRVLQHVARPATVEAPARHARYVGSPLDCRRTDSSAKLAPYPSDCQKYWRCVGGLPQVATCSDGLFYNAHTQQCDFEGNAKCEVTQEDELQTEFIVYK